MGRIGIFGRIDVPCCRRALWLLSPRRPTAPYHGPFLFSICVLVNPRSPYQAFRLFLCFQVLTVVLPRAGISQTGAAYVRLVRDRACALTGPLAERLVQSDI